MRTLMRMVLLGAAALVLSAGMGTYARWGSTANAQKDKDKKGGSIEREVLHELRMLPDYTVFDNLGFRVEGDHVTLEGAVTKPILKSEAENVTKKVEGVASVTNNIKVLPLSPNDDGIRRATYRAIYGESGLWKYASASQPSIHIIVDNGHVTLEGVVDNDGDKNLAGIRANSVPGVFSVTNNLVVQK